MISPKVWTTACPDWEERIVAKQSLMPCEPLFPQVADVAERIFKELILVDVMGSPKMGDVTLEWVIEFVRAMASDETMFQFLIGNLIMHRGIFESYDIPAFQFLIGNLIIRWGQW